MPMTAYSDLPYPTATDIPYVHLDLKNLADAVDEALTVVDTVQPPHRVGRRWYNPTTKRSRESDGTTWFPTDWANITLDSGLTNTTDLPTFAYSLEDGGKTLRLRGTRLTYTGALPVTAGTDYPIATGANVLPVECRPAASLRYATIHGYAGIAPMTARLSIEASGAIRWRPSFTGNANLIEFGDVFLQIK